MQIGKKSHDIAVPIVQLLFALSLLANFGLILVDSMFFILLKAFVLLISIKIFIFNIMDFYSVFY